METDVPTKVQKTIEAMLEFANLPQIDSDDQVQAVFQKLPFQWAGHHLWLTPGAEPAPHLRSLVDRRRIDPLALQRDVRRWLDRIVGARGNQRSLRRIASSVSDALGRKPILSLRIDTHSFRLTTEFEGAIGSKGQGPWTSITADLICYLGIAHLFDWRLLRRLRSCPIEHCGRFRVTYVGKPWNYCSIAHQREGERLRAKYARARLSGGQHRRRTK